MQPCDDEYVALLKSADHLHKLGAVSLGAARLLAVDLGATGAAQFVLVQIQILVARRGPSVAVHRHRFAPLSQIRYAANKCRLFNVKFFLLKAGELFDHLIAGSVPRVDPEGEIGLGLHARRIVSTQMRRMPIYGACPASEAAPSPTAAARSSCSRLVGTAAPRRSCSPMASLSNNEVSLRPPDPPPPPASARSSAPA